ncbi:MAG: secondary thiamine-phosphate synthase enzyme YjbQ [Candidatus Bathyarchaeota archaeon]|nr:secondary thiamine-phosphate synthase enzyme YjbQ [Candidatus Bathyarchaeota archaeon]
MKIHSRNLYFSTDTRMEVREMTEEVRGAVEESGIKNGLVNLWVLHDTAAIAVGEKESEVWEDLLLTLKRLVPIEGNYYHNAKYGWGPAKENAHAHILNFLIKPNLTIPLEEGKMLLGRYQSILFIEMAGSKTRKLNVQVMGE